MAGGGAGRRQAALRREGLAALGMDLDDLLARAEALRREVWGDTVSMCAVVNARCGLCPEDCAFCAQSSHHRSDVRPYTLVGPTHLVEAARRAGDSGARRLGIVTSGPRLSEGELDVVCEGVRRIREEGHTEPCASLGELTPEYARRLYEAGLRRYHHNLETSRRFFPRICTTHAYDDRVRTVRIAREAGLEVCCGGLFGMGESWEDRVDLAVELRFLGVSSIPVNFLMPIPGTPLADRPLMDAEEALRTVALFRILVPEAEVRVCGGRQLVLGEMQQLMYRAGATGVMIGDFLTQPGSPPEEDIRLARELGLEIDRCPTSL